MLKVTSIFAQVLSIISRRDFFRTVKKHQAEKGAKGFSCWDQFVAMLFCQFGGANSLREICGGLATAMGKLRHLGMADAPSHSTLSYANAHRPWRLYEDIFYSVIGNARDVAATKKRRFRFKNSLRSLDASVKDLCLDVFDWARATTIAGIYKDRWQIELFFKALKQNLKVKTFVGTSENAVKIQIWTALISILLLKLMQLKSSFGWSLSNLAAMVRMNLLTYRDL